MNYLVRQVPAGKKALLINLDETAVCLWQGTQRGTVLVSKKRKREEPIQRVNRATRRTYLTHVAIVCDTPSYQKCMPHIIIGNEHTLRMRDLPALQGQCPSNFTVVRQKSSWNNTSLMCTIVRKLREALAPFAAKVQPILLMDAVKLHWAPAVMAACRRQGIWPVPVPAKLTWLLQPCDTHLFREYKLQLQKNYQLRRQETMAAGALDVQDLLGCIYDTTKFVFEDSSGWRRAFLEDGFGAKQARLSGFRMQQMELDGRPTISDLQPSQEQVQLCFPQRQRPPPMSQLFSCSMFQVPLPAPAVPPTLPAPSDVPRGARLFRGASPGASSSGLGVGGPAARAGREPRTRAEHRLLALAKASPPGA